MSVFEVILVRIQSKCGKIRTRLIPNTDTLHAVFNPLSTNPTKWWSTFKQVVGNLPMNCLSVFDNFVGLTLIGLIWLFPRKRVSQFQKKVYSKSFQQAIFFRLVLLLTWDMFLMSKYLFKVNNKDPRTVFMYFVLVPFLLNLNKYFPNKLLDFWEKHGQLY